MARRNEPDAISRRGSGQSRAALSWRRGSRLLGTFTVLLGLTAMVIAGAALAGGASDTGTHTWKVEPTPNPVSADISYLSSVSCPSRQACTAVGGSSHTLSSSSLTLAERWNGNRWSIQPIPTPKGTSDGVSGVSCPSGRACVAVGGAFHMTRRRQTTLTEAWNGKRWRVQATPTIKAPSALYAVSCTSASSCVAVGHTLVEPSQAIVERWNGKTWRLQALPPLAKDTQLSGVSCSSPRACTAVGWNNATGNTWPLALSWNGKEWRVQVVPLPYVAPPSRGPRIPRTGMFDAVSCTSPRACTATGTDFNHPRGPTLAERWNGKTWRVEPTPNPPNWSASLAEITLDGVSCTSDKACTAIGEYNPGHRTQYFIEFWNGKRWRLAPAPHPADFAHGALLGISCASARCTGVGAYTGSVRLQVTLAIGD
jgi:hypothetical protein